MVDHGRFAEGVADEAWRYHPRFDDFRTAIQTCLSDVSTVHRNALKKLMPLNFQTFENVSLLSA